MNTVEVASWKARRAAYVRPSDSTDGCPCTVRFLYSASGELARASILIQYATAFTGADDTTQDIILSISPENTRSCRLALSSEDYLVPPLVIPHIPTTTVCGPSDVVTLTLTLKTLGVVLHPPNISSFHPASDANEASFEAFVKICQATDIQLHFAMAQFGLVGTQKSERMQLRQFVGDFNTSQTEPVEFDLTSANSGRGLKEGTWRVFQPCSAAILPTGVLGKRRRAGMNRHVSAFCKQLADTHSLRCHVESSSSVFRRLLKHSASLLPNRDHDTFPDLCIELASLES